MWAEAPRSLSQCQWGQLNWRASRSLVHATLPPALRARSPSACSSSAVRRSSATSARSSTTRRSAQHCTVCRCHSVTGLLRVRLMPAVGMRHSRHAAAARSSLHCCPLLHLPLSSALLCMQMPHCGHHAVGAAACIQPHCGRSRTVSLAAGSDRPVQCASQCDMLQHNTPCCNGGSDRTPSAPSGVCHRRLAPTPRCVYCVCAAVDNAMPRGVGRMAHRPPRPGAHAAAVPRPPRYLPPACRAPPQTTRLSMVMA
jgi:hypothetical protein